MHERKEIKCRGVQQTDMVVQAVTRMKHSKMKEKAVGLKSNFGWSRSMGCWTGLKE
jgi:hypothetical protein